MRSEQSVPAEAAKRVSHHTLNVTRGPAEPG